MIFSGINKEGTPHIELIFQGKKTQTRRASGRYEVGKTYAIQPKRCKPADPRGRIRIIEKVVECLECGSIGNEDALLEGGYTPEEYEALYQKTYPGWQIRYAYTFTVEPAFGKPKTETEK